MIRELQWRDMDDLVENYYSFYDELKETPDFGIIFHHERPNLGAEVEWFSSLYKDAMEGNAVVAVAEEDGRVVGLCDVRRNRPGTETSHSAVLGIAIKKGYRGRGIGEALMRRVIELSRGRFEIIKLEVFSVNARARHLYEKIGFVEYGTLPNSSKRGDKYYDSVLMYYKV